MNVRNISHFEGLLTTLGRGKASLFSLLQARNIRTNNHEAELRKGQLYISDLAHKLAGTIHSVYQYSRDALSFVEGVGTWSVYREYVISIMLDAGSEMNYYGWDGDLENTIDRINEDSEGVRIALTSDDMWAAQYMDWMWLVNGRDAMYKYDGINFLKAGIAEPTGGLVFARTGNLNDFNGNFPGPSYRKYKFRYVRIVRGAEGIYEYTASPFSGEYISIDFDGESMDVTPALATDEQITHIELYGTEMRDTVQELDGLTYYRMDNDRAHHNLDYSGIPHDDFANFEDTITNEDLLGETVIQWTADGTEHVRNTALYHPELTDPNSWRNPPDRLKFLTYYKDRLYAVSEDVRSTPLYSDLAEPESWYIDNWLEVRRDDGGYVTGFAAHGNSLYIFKNQSIWALTGDPDASPNLQPLSGGERTGNQTEVGVGCTAPRSIATYGEDLILFYSSLYGVYKIQNGQILQVSQGIEMLGLDNETSGVVWLDDKGEAFYTLSPPSGVAWVLHIRSGMWWNDDNINVPCFCTDSNGYALGGENGYINRYYHPDQEDDNGTEYFGTMQTAWLNLRRADEDAVLRSIQIQKRNLYRGCTVKVENEKGDVFSADVSGDERKVGIENISGRLFSYTFTWAKGFIESVTTLYKRRRGH